MHYDFGDAFYGDKLSNRPHLTTTIENFKADKWGSTFFFVDLDFGENTMKSAYAEISRELRFWEAPFAAHIEYNGGLSGSVATMMLIWQVPHGTGPTRISARHSHSSCSTNIWPTNLPATSTVGS